jgi:hypothetical protein
MNDNTDEANLESMGLNLSVTPLIHIGYVKTGSTWLQEHFFGNEKFGHKILVPREELEEKLVKPYELWYDPKIIRQEIKSVSQAFRGTSHLPVLTHERLSGNAMSGGFDAIIIADRLHEALPNARILIVIREQRKMALSIYKQFVIEGGPTSLKNFINPLPDTKVPWFEREFLEFHRLIAYYQKLFGKGNVCVLPFEKFLQDKVVYCNDIVHFAGGIPVEAVDEKKVRPSLSGWATTIRRPFNLFLVRDDVNPGGWFHFPRLVRYIGGTRHLLGRSINKHFDQKMINYIAQEFDRFYVESNRLTCEITGLDLKQYGYML